MSNRDVGQTGEAGQYSGPAPTPSRKIDLTGAPPDGAELNPDTLVPMNEPASGNFDPGVQSTDLPPLTQTSPSPTQPDVAAELAEYKQRLGQATNTIGQMKKDFDTRMNQEMETMRLNMEVAMASQQAPAAPAGQLPQGINPEDTPTWEQMGQLLNNLPNVVTAQAIQATWDVQPHEVQAAYAANPAFQNLPEPRRTQLIQRQVQLMRQQQAATTPPQAQASPATPQPQRSVEHVTPFVEGNAGSPAFNEPAAPGSGDRVAAANREYIAAQKIENPKERKRAMRIAWEKSLAASGISLDALGESSFKVGDNGR